MKNRTTIFALAIVVLATCALAALSLRTSHYPPSAPPQSTLAVVPNCIKLHSGIAVAEIVYPEQFFVHAQQAVNSTISFATSSDVVSGEEFLLTVRASIGDSLADLISGRELGPKYSTSSLNGYTVGLHHGQYWDSYVLIPEGARDGFFIDYHESIIPKDERASAETLLHGIKISTTTENLNLARVEKCMK